MFEWMILMPSDVEPLPKHRKRLAAREAQNKCIVIERDEETGKAVECDCQAFRRGRCHHHNYTLRKMVLETPKEQRLALLNKLVREGQLLQDRQGQRKKRKVSA